MRFRSLITLLCVTTISGCTAREMAQEIESARDSNETKTMKIADDSAGWMQFIEDDTASQDTPEKSESMSEETEIVTETTDSLELFEKFLKDEEGLIIHSDVDLGYNLNFSDLKDGGKYKLSELVATLYDYINNGMVKHEVKLEFIKYAYIDCGNDNVPELAVWIYMPGTNSEIWEDFLIIKDVDGELNLCYAQDAWGRSVLNMNEFGYVRWDCSDGAAHHIYENTAVDADGKLQKVYRLYLDYWTEGISTPGIDVNAIGDAANDVFLFAFNFDNYEDEGNVYTYTYAKDWKNESDNKCISFYDYSVRYEDTMYVDDNPVMKELRRSGKTVYSLDEVETIIKQKLESFGATEDIVNGKDATWQYLDIPNSLNAYRYSDDNIFGIHHEFPMELTFSSGAGAWATVIKIEKDGSFSGAFHDSDMGGGGDGYDASEFECEFTGKFGNVTKINDYTISTELLEITIKDYPENEWIEEVQDGIKVKHFVSTPYGLDDGAKTYYLYLPSTPVEGLDETFLTWVFVDPTAQYLEHYCLYDVDGQESYGFSDY